MPGQFPAITPTVRTLIVMLVVFFLGQTAVQGLFGIPITSWAALSSGLHVDLAWQWATYWLVAVIQQPGDVFWHLLSIFILYWCLSTFEAENGRGRLLALVATGIVGGALPVMIGGVIAPSLFGITAGTITIFYAWLGALPVMRPGAKVGLWIATIPPISAWTIVGGTLALTAMQAAWMRDLAPIVAACGAIGAGVLYGRFVMAPRKTSKPSTPPKKRAGRPNLKVIEGGANDEDDGKPRWLN